MRIAVAWARRAVLGQLACNASSLVDAERHVMETMVGLGCMTAIARSGRRIGAFRLADRGGHPEAPLGRLDGRILQPTVLAGPSMQRHANVDPLHGFDLPIEARALVVGQDPIPRESFVGRPRAVSISTGGIDTRGTETAGIAPVPDFGATAEETDVVVWDLGPGAPTLEPGALDRVSVPVVALVADGVHAGALLAAGIAAVLPRSVDAVALRSAVQTVRHGLTVVDPALLQLAGNAPADASDQIEAGPPLLTPREQQVLELLARGISNKAIAGDLGVSGHTAKFHIASIMFKLDADTRTQAVVTALRRGLLAL